MNTSLVKISIVSLIILTTTTSFGMRTFIDTEKRKELGLTPSPLRTKKIEPLKRKTIGFTELPCILQQKIAAQTPPACTKNLRETCKSSYENITLQTPKVWDLIGHSMQCISKNNMNVLILKATLCEQDMLLKKIQDYIKENDFFGCCRSEYNYRYLDHCGKEITGFFYYPEDTVPRPGHPLIIVACCTNDTNIVADVIKSSKKFEIAEIDLCLAISIKYENPPIIKMLCDLKQNTSERIGHYGSADFTVFFDNAVRMDTINAFESLISYNTSELNNHLSYSCDTYLDSLCKQHETQKNLQQYIDIVEKYGGKHAKTLWEEQKENLITKYFS